MLEAFCSVKIIVISNFLIERALLTCKIPFVEKRSQLNHSVYFPGPTSTPLRRDQPQCKIYRKPSNLVECLVKHNALEIYFSNKIFSYDM